jgi:hypothetical protein
MMRMSSAAVRNLFLLTVAMCLAIWAGMLHVHPVAAASPSSRAGNDPNGDPCNPGLYSDLMSTLGIDYLNDENPPPHAFNVPSGTLAPGQSARFRVYALSQFGGFPTPDVTRFFLHPSGCPHSSPTGRVRVRAAPGSANVAGTVRTIVEDGQAIVVYTPKRTASVDRAALIEFRYKMGLPGAVYLKVFPLTVQGVPPGAAPAARPSD